MTTCKPTFHYNGETHGSQYSNWSWECSCGIWHHGARVWRTNLDTEEDARRGWERHAASRSKALREAHIT